MMGDEADADWDAGLIEAGYADTRMPNNPFPYRSEWGDKLDREYRKKLRRKHREQGK